MKATAEKERTLAVPCMDCGDYWVCGQNATCGEPVTSAGGWIDFGNIKFKKPVSKISLKMRLNREGGLEVRVIPTAA